MTLRLFNSLTRTKEDFHPLDAENVRLYVCGPTVYDYAHIGNARPAIVFDVLYRLLRHVYGKDHVKYVRNITDVDDKINARALQEYPGLALNEAVAEVTSRTTEQYHADIAALGCLKPDVEPTCTGHIPDMVEMIKALIEKDCAYVAEGHVLFEVEKAKDYGTLSRRSLDEMIAGARVEVAPYKKNPMDFVLWKPSDAETPGWPSPWGRGRPGWHIECSAMAAKHLGKVFDIHGGGIDLQFPHHENELAQTRCAFASDKMASVWMHNGFLQVEGQKMSKSLGNFITIHELLNEGWDGRVLRFLMLKTHYRQPINWTRHGLNEAVLELRDFAKHVGDSTRYRNEHDPAFLDALRDDLNTPEAIKVLHDLKKATLGKRSGGAIIADEELDKAYARFGNALALLGLERLNDLDREKEQSVNKAEINTLIAARKTARAAKNWAEADRIRDELTAMGIQLMDAKDSSTGEIVTTWEVKR